MVPFVPFLLFRSLNFELVIDLCVASCRLSELSDLCFLGVSLDRPAHADRSVGGEKFHILRRGGE